MLDRSFGGLELINKALSEKPRDDGWIEIISKNFVAL
jgi:hypothetical protein